MTKKKIVEEFVNKWKDREGYEKGEAQSFWNSLLRDIFDVARPEEYIDYENRVYNDNKSRDFIDGYIGKTRVLIEQKSSKVDLNKKEKQSDGSSLTPYEQAKKYADSLPVDEHPYYIVTCNFNEFHVHDMKKKKDKDIPEVIYLKDLPKEYNRLSFLVNKDNTSIQKENDLSVKAGEIIGKVYDKLIKQYNNIENKKSHESLNKLCVRLVFCLYAEDSELFKRKNQFHDYLAKFPASGIRQALVDLFKVLDTKEEDRQGLYLNEDVLDFPYVNGGLFTEEIEIPLFTDEIKDLVIKNASEDFDWSEISPTIFGATFESTLNPETRRSGGMHYTSIENINKVIYPLFMDELKNEYEQISKIKVKTTQKKRANEFQEKLASLKFLDPACGSGNFLTETYICLRKLENETIKLTSDGSLSLFDPIKVNINQFYGIEINDFAVSVAKTALWIAETQMKKETEGIFSFDVDYLPLKSNTNIIEGNALTLDWNEIAY